MLKDGEPQAILTGGTNFSEGGIFGHSNAVHIVEESEVARAYARYWDLLSTDPKSAALRPKINDLYVLPDGKPPQGTGAIFSPRNGLDALDWYSRLASSAETGLFMTFAFGIHPAFQEGLSYRQGAYAVCAARRSHTTDEERS
ncbi:MAG: hypothetical protein IPK19_20420 [Chloroflexi bacterium]|nr:hypothetical protein [Chloroflexota bacterium]